MFLDASAIVAILLEESDAASLAKRIEQSAQPYTSPIAVYEAVAGVARRLNVTIPAAGASLDRFLASARVQIVPITAEIGRGALSAFERFGRGRHRAALNMGDCFAYACARQLDLPLLFKGDDFPLTDITVA
jgi:ribonuclease VapC